MMSMNIHFAKSIAFERHYPENDNSVTLLICSRDDERFELTLFGLSDDQVAKLRDGLGAPAQIYRKDEIEEAA